MDVSAYKPQLKTTTLYYADNTLTPTGTAH